MFASDQLIYELHLAASQTRGTEARIYVRAHDVLSLINFLRSEQQRADVAEAHLATALGEQAETRLGELLPIDH